MTIRKLVGSATLGGIAFWKDIAAHDGWRVQYNATLDVGSPLKPYRLLDPSDQLWASADEARELASALPELIREFAARKPILGREQMRELGASAVALLVNQLIAQLDAAAREKLPQGD